MARMMNRTVVPPVPIGPTSSFPAKPPKRPAVTATQSQAAPNPPTLAGKGVPAGWNPDKNLRGGMAGSEVIAQVGQPQGRRTYKGNTQWLYQAADGRIYGLNMTGGTYEKGGWVLLN